MTAPLPRVVALCGGVGGARLAHGLCAALPPEQLTLVVNTGDDFDHWGLRICPDLDTVMYTLAGLADRVRGWGLADESFAAHARMQALGDEGWFALGDRDLATHLLRTEALRRGEGLTAVTADLCRRHGVAHAVLPMADTPRPTLIETRDEGTLSFQDWLVRRRGEPVVRAVLSGAPTPATPAVLAALDAADAIVIAPSNPYVSIDPIVALDGVRERLARPRVVGVSPIIGGRAVKGPLAEMIPALADEPPSAAAVARHYGGWLDGFVVEHGDAEGVPVEALEAATLMRTDDDRRQLAEAALRLAGIR